LSPGANPFTTAQQRQATQTQRIPQSQLTMKITGLKHTLLFADHQHQAEHPPEPSSVQGGWEAPGTYFWPAIRLLIMSSFISPKCVAIFVILDIGYKVNLCTRIISLTWTF